MLRRVPQLSFVDLSRDDFALSLSAPPDLTRLSISDVIADDAFSLDAFPFVLAADPSGLLLVTDSYGHADDSLGADRPAYFVWDASVVSTHQESVNHSGNVGFIVTPSDSDTDLVSVRVDRRGHDFTVAELLPVSAGESVTILCYDSYDRVWVKKTLPFPMPHYPWSSAHVFSHDRKLWWVDLRHGILSCDPSADAPQVLFVPFPDGAAALMRGRDIGKHRCVNLSDGKLRFVEMAGSARVPRVAVWTLVDPEACAWELDYDVKLREIWADESYEGTGLRKKRPVLAGVRPADPAVVYFINQGKLFGVNLGTRKVDECVPFEPALTDPTALDIDEESSRFLLTWDLPPSLTSLSVSGQKHGKESSAQTIEERTPRTEALRMLSYFMNAYTSAFGKLEYDELARIAIAHLNRKIKKRENKFKLSERHLLCSFDQNKGSCPKNSYAHMNFYVHRDCKTKRLRQLVFAEFAKAVTDDDTGRSLCFDPIIVLFPDYPDVGWLVHLWASMYK